MLNGEPYEFEGSLTVNQLLAKLGIDPRHVAVEHNLVVLKRAAYDSTLANEGDQVELVNFVGGGTVDPSFSCPSCFSWLSGGF